MYGLKNRKTTFLVPVLTAGAKASVVADSSSRALVHWPAVHSSAGLYFHSLIERRPPVAKGIRSCDLVF